MSGLDAKVNTKRPMQIIDAFAWMDNDRITALGKEMGYRPGEIAHLLPCALAVVNKWAQQYPDEATVGNLREALIRAIGNDKDLAEYLAHFDQHMDVRT